MAGLTPEDEALIQRFVGLSTGESSGNKVVLPQVATTSTSWDLSLLLKVISDRSVLDGPFTFNMQQAWDVDSATIIRPISKNLFLAEFTT